MTAESGHSSQSLPFLEQSYKRNSDDENAAVAYAAALRRADQLSRAGDRLAALRGQHRFDVTSRPEYAAIQLAQGNYTSAEDFAQKAIIQDEKNFEAYHYLGIALDARSMHKEAERSFRKGLELWEGDPTTIMNNLALNLTSQGYLDEAATILQKAQSISPDRVELERNLRIVNALRESGGYAAPKPSAKPTAFGPQPQ
ncbi:MAG: tetratricopeptide repeat protein [Alphaproteobacteria bacterium]